MTTAPTDDSVIVQDGPQPSVVNGTGTESPVQEVSKADVNVIFHVTDRRFYVPTGQSKFESFAISLRSSYDPVIDSVADLQCNLSGRSNHVDGSCGRHQGDQRRRYKR